MKHRFAKFWRYAVFLAFLFFLRLAFAQNPDIPANQIDVVIRPEVTFAGNGSFFHYGYSIESKPDSVQKVWNFTLEFLDKKAKPFDASGPPGWQDAYITPEVPRGGPNKVAPGSMVNWGGDDTIDFIPPGHTLEGLFCESKGLPGIVRSWTQGYVPLPPPVHQVGPELSARLPDPYSSFENVILKTVGPDVLPTNLSNDQLLDRLISLKEQAFQLGWIDNQGVANSLDAKLNEVKVKLQAGQTNTAANILKSFILDLIAQHIGQTGQGQGQGNPQGKHVNDNAFYLLKPNAEFILYKLGQL